MLDTVRLGSCADFLLNYLLDFRYWQTDEDVIYEESNGPTENLPLHRYIHSKYIWTLIYKKRKCKWTCRLKHGLESYFITWSLILQVWLRNVLRWFTVKSKKRVSAWTCGKVHEKQRLESFRTSTSRYSLFHRRPFLLTYWTRLVPHVSMHVHDNIMWLTCSLLLHSFPEKERAGQADNQRTVCVYSS